MPGCLSDDELRQYHAGLLPEEQRAWLEAHMAACPSCVERGDAFSQRRDTQRTEHPVGAGPPAPEHLLDVGAAALPAFAVDGYDHLRELHRGGQGVVYQAIQQTTKRKVAVKVLLEGAGASRAAQRRFEREIELVAQLKHPNIISIFHSGRTRDGRQFCVMDYVRGLRLDEHVRQRKPALRGLLELFATICDAVAYAHQRGIIHRDLKPSNILVDAQAMPKVLDFGLAKQLVGPVETLASMTGQVFGTLPFLSPEQVRGNPEEIDTRTDIYALGVILYHLLTGQYPYPVEGQLAEVISHIAETPPTPPSRSWTAEHGLIAAQSGAAQCPIDHELETIVLKALAKDRERRYQSANEFARDIRHYLAGEPIDAKRDSTWYVLKKTLQRYKLPVTMAAVLLLVITAAMFTSVALWKQAAAERDQKESALQDARDQREAAEQAQRAEEEQRRLAEERETEARIEAERANTVIDFVQEMLGAANPFKSNDPDYTVRQMLDNFSAGLGDQLAGEPEVDATIRYTIGTAYKGLGAYDKAEEHLRAALQIRRQTYTGDHPNVALSLSNVGSLLRQMGKPDEAERLFRESLEMYRRLHGEEHRRVATLLGNIAGVYFDRGEFEKSEQVYRESLATLRELLGDQHADVASALDSLALVLTESGDLNSAEPLLREAITIHRKLHGDDSPETGNTLNSLASLLYNKRDFAAAEPIYREALAMTRKYLGEDHPTVSGCRTNLASVLQSLGKYDEAEPFAREALASFRRTFGDDHPNVALSHNSLAAILYKKGDMEGAESNYRTALAIFREVLGNEHPTLATILTNLAILLETNGDLDGAEPLYREALAIRQNAFGDDHAQVVAAMSNVADVHRKKRKFAKAEELYRLVLPSDRRLLGKRHRTTASTLCNLGIVLNNQQKYDEAEIFLREGLEIRRAILPPDHWLIPDTMSVFGEVLLGLEKYEEAESVLIDAYEQFQRLSDVPQATVRKQRAITRIADLYDASNRPDQAAEWRARLQPVTTAPAATPAPSN